MAKNQSIRIQQKGALSLVATVSFEHLLSEMKIIPREMEPINKYVLSN